MVEFLETRGLTRTREAVERKHKVSMHSFVVVGCQPARLLSLSLQRSRVVT